MHNRLKNRKQNKKGRLATPEVHEEDHENAPPFFSLRYLKGKFCLTKCDRDQKAAFAITIHKLSTLTWAEIRTHDRHGLGTEVIKQSAIKTPLPPCVTKEVTLIAFRFWKKAPMVGFKDKGIFYVLYLDPKFELYDHG